MTKEEELAQLRERLVHCKLDAFGLLHCLVNGSVKLEHVGYKDLGQAARSIMQDAAKEIEKLTRDFEKKYPS